MALDSRERRVTRDGPSGSGHREGDAAYHKWRLCKADRPEQPDLLDGLQARRAIGDTRGRAEPSVRGVDIHSGRDELLAELMQDHHRDQVRQR